MLTAAYIHRDEVRTIKQYDFENIITFRKRMRELAMRNECDVSLQMDGDELEIIDGLYEQLEDWAKSSVIEFGVLRWRSNGNVPPKDILVKMYKNGVISQAVLLESQRAGEEDLKKAIGDYVKAQAARSPEEAAETAAEIKGSYGESVMNIITGEKY